ncbi:hypothetical protein HDU96_002627 [Phlyctochytrium bullatum]|nr:hypothetical protein HDU96_002627 [Phlyctochytrium bullatum]
MLAPSSRTGHGGGSGSHLTVGGGGGGGGLSTNRSWGGSSTNLSGFKGLGSSHNLSGGGHGHGGPHLAVGGSNHGNALHPSKTLGGSSTNLSGAPSKPAAGSSNHLSLPGAQSTRSLRNLLYPSGTPPGGASAAGSQNLLLPNSSSNSLGSSKRHASMTASTLMLYDTARPQEAARRQRKSQDAAQKAQVANTPSRCQFTAGAKLRSQVTNLVQGREGAELLKELRKYKEEKAEKRRDEIARAAAMAVKIQMGGGNPLGRPSVNTRDAVSSFINLMVEDEDDDEEEVGLSRVGPRMNFVSEAAKILSREIENRGPKPTGWPGIGDDAEGSQFKLGERPGPLGLSNSWGVGDASSNPWSARGGEPPSSFRRIGPAGGGGMAAPAIQAAPAVSDSNDSLDIPVATLPLRRASMAKGGPAAPRSRTSSLPADNVDPPPRRRTSSLPARDLPRRRASSAEASPLITSYTNDRRRSGSAADTPATRDRILAFPNITTSDDSSLTLLQQRDRRMLSTAIEVNESRLNSAAVSRLSLAGSRRGSAVGEIRSRRGSAVSETGSRRGSAVSETGSRRGSVIRSRSASVVGRENRNAGNASKGEGDKKKTLLSSMPLSPMPPSPGTDDGMRPSIVINVNDDTARDRPAAKTIPDAMAVATESGDQYGGGRRLHLTPSNHNLYGSNSPLNSNSSISALAPPKASPEHRLSITASLRRLASVNKPSSINNLASSQSRSRLGDSSYSVQDSEDDVYWPPASASASRRGSVAMSFHTRSRTGSVVSSLATSRRGSMAMSAGPTRRPSSVGMALPTRQQQQQRRQSLAGGGGGPGIQGAGSLARIGFHSIAGSIPSLAGTSVAEVLYPSAAASTTASRRGSIKPGGPATSASSASGSVSASRRGSLAAASVGEKMKRKLGLRGVAIAVKMTVSMGPKGGVGKREVPFKGTFLTAVDTTDDGKKVYGQSFAFMRFRKWARVVTLLINFFKFLSRILHNPIQWGWEHDPDANLFSRSLTQFSRRGGRDGGGTDAQPKGIISTDFSVGKLFNTQKVFKGWLPEQMRELFRKPPKMRSENDISEMQVWASGMKAFKEFPPAVQKMLLRVGRYERWHGGRIIVKEGHIATNYYILLDGEIEVSRINREVVEMHLAKLHEQFRQVRAKRRAARRQGSAGSSRTRRRRTRSAGSDEDEQMEERGEEEEWESEEEEEEEDEESELDSEEEREIIEFKKSKLELEKIYTDVLGTQSSGESFGELAFINGNIRLASITTKRTTEFLIIERQHFEKVMSISQDTDIREKMAAMREVAIFKTLSVNLGNLARYVDIKTYPPNGVIVCEGDLCEYVYFLRSGTCRVIKAIPFLKIPISRDKYVFRPVHGNAAKGAAGKAANLKGISLAATPLPEATDPASLFSEDPPYDSLTSLSSSLPSAAAAAGPACATTGLGAATLVTKFVVVQYLHPGDHFYDGDSSKTPRELYLASGLGTSASRSSVVANLKTELLRISKLDFNKFATKATWREFVERTDRAVPPIERLSEAYMGKREWELYKRGIVEEVVRRCRRNRAVAVFGGRGLAGELA